MAKRHTEEVLIKQESAPPKSPVVIDKNLIANPTDFLPNRKFQTIAFSYLFINIIFVIIEIGKLSIHISILIKTEHLDGQPPYIFRPERQLHIALLRNNGICLDKYPEPSLPFLFIDRLYFGKE